MNAGDGLERVPVDRVVHEKYARRVVRIEHHYRDRRGTIAEFGRIMDQGGRRWRFTIVLDDGERITRDFAEPTDTLAFEPTDSPL